MLTESAQWHLMRVLPILESLTKHQNMCVWCTKATLICFVLPFPRSNHAQIVEAQASEAQAKEQATAAQGSVTQMQETLKKLQESAKTAYEQAEHFKVRQRDSRTVRLEGRYALPVRAAQRTYTRGVIGDHGTHNHIDDVINVVCVYGWL